MDHFTFPALYFLIGIFLITLVDILGAVSSRTADYSYTQLAGLSFIVYTFLGYLLSKVTQFEYVIILSCLAGVYDATVGWKLALGFKANIKLTEEELEKVTLTSRLVVMICLSALFGYIGYCIGK